MGHPGSSALFGKHGVQKVVPGPALPEGVLPGPLHVVLGRLRAALDGALHVVDQLPRSLPCFFVWGLAPPVFVAFQENQKGNPLRVVLRFWDQTPKSACQQGVTGCLQQCQVAGGIQTSTCGHPQASQRKDPHPKEAKAPHRNQEPF